MCKTQQKKAKSSRSQQENRETKGENRETKTPVEEDGERNPFQCRSPYLKDYREARDQLTPKQLLLVDYAFLPPDELHPSTEKLFEFEYEEEDKKLWIFRKGFETLARTD